MQREIHIVWKSFRTNYYSLGKTEAPEGIKVFGGKTGNDGPGGMLCYSV